MFLHIVTKIKLKRIWAIGLAIILVAGTVVPSFATEFTKDEIDKINAELAKGDFTEYSAGQVTKDIIPDDLFREAVNTFTPNNLYHYINHGADGDKIMGLNTKFSYGIGHHSGYPKGMKSIEGYKRILSKNYINEYFDTQLSEKTKKYCKEKFYNYGYMMDLPLSVEGELDVSETRISTLKAQGKISNANLKGCKNLTYLALGQFEGYAGNQSGIRGNKVDKLPDLSDCEILEACDIASDDNNPNLVQRNSKLKYFGLQGKSTNNINLRNLPDLMEVKLFTDETEMIDLSQVSQLRLLCVHPYGMENVDNQKKCYYWKPKAEVDKIKKVKEIKLPKYEDDGLKMSALNVSGNSLAKIDLSNVIFGYNGMGNNGTGGTIQIKDPKTGEYIVAPILGQQFLEESHEYYMKDGKYVIDLKPVLGERKYLDKVQVQNQHDGRYGAKYDKDRGLLIYDKLPDPGNVNDDYMGYTLMCPDKAQHEWPMDVNFTNLKEGKPPQVSIIKDLATGIELKGEGLKADMSLKITPRMDMSDSDIKSAQKAIVKGVIKGYGIFNLYDIRLMQHGKEIKLKQPSELTIPVIEGLNDKVIAVKDYDAGDNVYPSRFITGDTKLGKSSKNYGHTVKDGKIVMTVERLGVIGLIGAEKDVKEAENEEAYKNLQNAKAAKIVEIDNVILGDTKDYTAESIKVAEEKLNAMKAEAKESVSKAKSIAEVKAVKLPDVQIAKEFLETQAEADARKLKEAKKNKLAEIEKKFPAKDYTFNKIAYDKAVKEVTDEVNVLSTISEVNSYDVSFILSGVEKNKDIKLDQAKENAEKTLKAIDKNLYRADEQKKITEIVEAAIKEVKKAGTKEALENVVTSALKKINKLKTIAQYELEEAKEGKIAEINKLTLGDTKDYTAESVKNAEAQLTKLKEVAIKKVNEADSIDKVNSVQLPDVSEAKKLLKTLAQELATIKEEKIEEIINLSLGETEGYTDESVKKAEDKLDVLKDEMIKKVKAAKDKREVTNLNIDSIVSEAERILEVKPVFAKDSQNEFIKGIGNSLRIHIENASVKDLLSVKLADKVLIKDKDYSVEEGSIVINIFGGVFDKLSGGQHLLSVVTTKGTLKENINVIEKAPAVAVNNNKAPEVGHKNSKPVYKNVSTERKAAKTSDDNNLELWVSIVMLLAFASVSVITLNKKNY